jgi:hypothetical protein
LLWGWKWDSFVFSRSSPVAWRTRVVEQVEALWRVHWMHRYRYSPPSRCHRHSYGHTTT